MKGYRVYYCAGPENLEIALNKLARERAEGEDWIEIEVYPHAGLDPRYTVVAQTIDLQTP